MLNPSASVFLESGGELVGFNTFLIHFNTLSVFANLSGHVIEAKNKIIKILREQESHMFTLRQL